MARSIATAQQGNKELLEIGLFVRTYHLDTIVSGLGCLRDSSRRSCRCLAKSWESLTLWADQPANNPLLGRNVLEAIKCNPSLNTIVAKGSARRQAQLWVDHVLKNLHHPEYAGLETLRLGGPTLGTSSGQENDNHAGTSIPVTDWIVPIDQANKIFKDASLECVTIVQEQALLLFYNLRGLTRLHVSYLSHSNEGEINGDIAGAERKKAKSKSTNAQKQETEKTTTRKKLMTMVKTPSLPTGHSSYVNALIFV
jgi:hypothetical protein